MKVAIIGAGSVVFARTLISDILSFPELAGCTIACMDIDESRLALIGALARRMADETRSGATIESTVDRREALDGADYVVTVLQVGGVEAFGPDVEIPLRYGVDQCVGDTLGPGGVFRALRTIPVFLDIARDMSELCPQALLLNYANPMSMVCWALSSATRVRNVGLCHSVQGTAAQLASYIGARVEDLEYWVAGINHMAWFLRLEWRGVDAYPALFERMRDPSVYRQDKVRFEMMDLLGYFVTESSGHFSEYVPYFRKRPALVEEFCTEGFGGETAFYLRHCREGWQPHHRQVQRQAAGLERISYGRSSEYAAQIMRSMETGVPCRVNATVDNAGIIPNLLAHGAVEVPCLVDGAGVHPCYVGDLPPQCAALNRAAMNVQELAVKAAIEKDRRAALQAVLLDPLTAAVLSTREIERMVDEMFRAEGAYLGEGW